MAKSTGKIILENVLLGSGVMIITPMISGFIPEMLNFDLSVITTGTVIAAGAAAYITNYLVGMVVKK